MNGTIAAELKVGLRFDRSQKKKLARIVAKLRSEGLKEHIHLFTLAFEAAKTGEPMVVACSDRAEVLAMADAFTIYGIKRPTVEELSA